MSGLDHAPIHYSADEAFAWQAGVADGIARARHAIEKYDDHMAQAGDFYWRQYYDDILEAIDALGEDAHE